MKRLHVDNINTAEYFNRIWQIEGIHGFDRVRMEAFLEELRSDEFMLDVGAGWMGIAQYAIAHGRLSHAWALDFSAEARRRTWESLGERKNMLAYDIGSALAIPYRDGCFDRVVCGELVEHMDHPEDLVKELFRVCKIGGRVIISTVDDQCEDAIRHGDYPEHLWAFSPEELLAYFRLYCAEPRYRLVGDYHFVEGVKA